MIRGLQRLAFAVLPALNWGCGIFDQDGGEVPACDGASLFQDEACMTGVMERCRAIEDEASCVGAPTVQASDWEVLCGWTLVTPLVDEATCELGSTFGRCEAGIRYLDGAAAFGTCDANDQIPDGISVFVQEQEFIQIDTTGPEVIGGVLGPWALVDAEPGRVAVCGEGWSPPGPTWCSCADAVCTAP